MTTTIIYNMMTLTISQRKPSTNSYRSKQSWGRDSKRETHNQRRGIQKHAIAESLIRGVAEFSYKITYSLESK